MREINNLKDDSEIDQKWALVSFASPDKKRVKGKTVGLFVYGAFDTEEDMQKRAEELVNEGNLYFDMEPVKIGKWLSFPDYDKDDRTKKNYLNKEKTNSMGNDVNLNDIIEGFTGNNDKKHEFESEQKKVIHEHTFLKKPKEKDQIENLLFLNCKSLLSCMDSLNFYNQGLDKNQERIDEMQDNEQETEIPETSTDFIEILKCNYPQKKMLFTYVDEEKTLQKGVDFCFKFRGAFSSVEETETRIKTIFTEDPVFNIYEIPIGQWIPFNCYKEDEEAYNDLNNILSYKINEYNEYRDFFDTRIKNAKNGVENYEDVVLNKKELLNTNRIIEEKIKSINEELGFFSNTFFINKKLVENTVIENPELIKILKELPEEFRSGLEEQKIVETF